MPGGRIEPAAARVTGPQPLLWLAWLCAAATITYVVSAPFWVADYPMMTEFPFHAASSSVFRHYTDPGWHFHEQFAFQMLAVPHVTLYALAATFMIVLPPIAATKLAAALLLALLPVGLMVLCWGLRKSPFLGLWGLVPVWGVLGHWGQVDFLAALGLFAMTLGLALRAVDRPSTRILTQAYRFPFALVMVLLVGVVMRGRVENVRALLIPLGVGTALFIVWWLTRAELFVPKVNWVWPPAWHRMQDAPIYTVDIFTGNDDTELFRRTGLLFGLTALLLLIVAVARLRSWPRGSWVSCLPSCPTFPARPGPSSRSSSGQRSALLRSPSSSRKPTRNSRRPPCTSARSFASCRRRPSSSTSYTIITALARRTVLTSICQPMCRRSEAGG